MSTFASCQIEAPRNKQSAAVLFTPHKHHAGVGYPINEPQPSPTHQPATHPPQNALQLGSKNLSDSDVEEELQEGLNCLNFESSSGSQSQSDFQSPLV